ncbi:MAG: hypothetical protein JXX28_14140 [Deltaproteobacteria bacterium]|nr:hypothetical protein [Deltaproteobacteria bacterium]
MLTKDWHVCADPETMDLANFLTDSVLMSGGALLPALPGLDRLDSFPKMDVLESKLGEMTSGDCALGEKNMIHLRSWETLQPYPHLILPYAAAHQELKDWEPRLRNDPQSYMIAWNPELREILILGATDLAAQYGAIAFLRDSHSEEDLVTWEAKSVLDYPELMLRVSSSKEMTPYGDLGSDFDAFYRQQAGPWMASTVWNRLTHVSNDTQLFAARALWPEKYEHFFDEKMAWYLRQRQLRMIPRLYAGQTSMYSTGPDLTGPMPRPLWGEPEDETPPPRFVIPPGVDPEDLQLGEVLVTMPDMAGVLKDPLGNAITDGIHLTEGMRVPLTTHHEDGDFHPDAGDLVPIPQGQLHFDRTKDCVFYDEFETYELDNSSRMEAHHDEYYVHSDENNARVLPDCRDSLYGVAGSDQRRGVITLCGGLGCPGYLYGEGTDGESAEHRYMLRLFIDAGGDYSTDHDPKEGHALPGTTDPYDFRPGHVYALALHYRLPHYLGDEEIDPLKEPLETELEPLSARLAELRAAEAALSDDEKLPPEDQAELDRLQRQVPDLEDAIAHYENRKGNLSDYAAKIDYVSGVDPHERPYHSHKAYLTPTGEHFDWATYVFKVPDEAVSPLLQADVGVNDREHYLRITHHGILEEALEIDALEVFELGATVAYPLVEDFDRGLASCRGLTPGCTMAVDGYAASYPPAIVEDAGLNEHGTPTSRLALPSVDFPSLPIPEDGFYHTVLTPGIWPASYLTAEEEMRDYYGPPELRIGQNIERPNYWQDYVIDHAHEHITDGALGGQLAQLHQLMDEHAPFFDPHYIDSTHAYTESRGFNRGRGFEWSEASNAERLTELHCRLAIELKRMGYSDGEPVGGWEPGKAPGYDEAEGACWSSATTSQIYYGDMLTKAHNGHQTYPAPWSGGVPWYSGEASPFEVPDLDTEYQRSKTTATIAPWWYHDDPEMVYALSQSFAEQGLPVLFWLGDLSRQDAHARGRGVQRVASWYLAGHPEESLGAAISYFSIYARDRKEDMTPEEQRAWEQVAADCMWNPRWSLLKQYTLDEEAQGEWKFTWLVNNIDATDYNTATAGTYYGLSPAVGNQASLELLPNGVVRLMEVSLPKNRPCGQRVMLRFFARAADPTYASWLRIEDGDWSSNHRFEPSTHFQVVELPYTPDNNNMELVFGNPGPFPLYIDGLAIYEEFPGFDLEKAENKQEKPVFPRDEDEQAVGWRYCTDDGFLP